MGSKARNDREFKKIERKMNTLHDQMVNKAFVQGVATMALEILADVKNAREGKGVPVDTGALRATGRMEANERRARISFGGAAAKYALRQHETLYYRHKIGEARYLIRGLERYDFAGSSSQRKLQMLAKAAARIAEATQ